MNGILLGLLIPALAAAAPVATNSPAPAGQVAVHMQGDRLTLHADDRPLTEVLTALSRLGVQVRVDPEIHARVTAHFDDRDAQEALTTLLKAQDYALAWATVPGPLGAMPRLAEIQVFQRGHRDRARPLPAAGKNFAVTGPAGGPRYVKDEALIGFRPGVLRSAALALLREMGGTIVESLPALGVYRVRFPPDSDVPALIERLRQQDTIAAAEPDYVNRLGAPVMGSGAGSGGAAAAQPPAGAAAVAVLDSGLLANNDLQGRLAGRFDAVDPGRELTDNVGHGTQMALIASGLANPIGTDGGAGAPVLAVRAFDDNGLASNFTLMQALEYAVQNGARVVNMSWGTEAQSAFMASAVAYAQEKGLVLVAAAGNEPTGNPVYPAAYSGVIGVGATLPDGQRWESSNYGGFVALQAPGIANLPVGYQGPPGVYAGTSIASAYVARALSDYFQAHAQATAADAATALKQAVGPGDGHNAQGGVLNAAALARFLK